ncbi:MAG: TonB-dependent receptor plug domain-containing protein [Verrucomicrobiales bacterium]
MYQQDYALQWSAQKLGLRSDLQRIAAGVVISCHFLAPSLGAEEVRHEEEIESLPLTTVLANRSEMDLAKVGSAVTVLDVAEFEKEGVYRLDQALRFVPGAVSESLSGQLGSASSLFLRGTVTNQTHVRVDGMRVSGSNISSGNFLGGAGTRGLSSIEVLRGPQSALYGGDAIGGVLGVYTKKGHGDHSGSLRFEGGSFDSFRSDVDLQGQFDRFSYALSTGYLQTDNDLPNNSFDQRSYSARFDYQATEDLSLGMTLRGFDSRFSFPVYSDASYPRSADDETESLLSTFFAEYRVNSLWSTKVTLGYYDEEYDSQTVLSTNYYQTSGTKKAIYWDNVLQWAPSHSTHAGAVFENTKFRYQSQFFGLTSDRRENDQYGFYLNHVWDVTEALTLTGGARWEDYDSYGDEATWRAAAAYRLAETGTKFRSSIGTGFRPPSFMELYGFGGGSNFNLEAEESMGWDVGVDQEFCDGDYRLSATYFENRIQNRIDSVFDFSTFTSVYFNAPGTSKTNGIELAASGNWWQDRLSATLSYTWLDRALSGQPEHSAGLRVSGEVTEKLDAGFNVTYLGDRTWGGNPLSSYAVTNLFASYELTPNVVFDARVENLFDKDYDYASFGGSNWPARGRGVFGGVTFLW